MFISKKIENLMNFRIVEEEMSSRIYLAMSKWLGDKGYFGAEALFKKYSEEELVHSRKAYEYLENLDILPTVPSLPQPDLEFDGLYDICKKALKHEMDISKQCNDLAKAALAENDFMTHELALWYLKEQNEELGKTTGWVNQFETYGQSPEILKLIDNEMKEVAEGD